MKSFITKKYSYNLLTQIKSLSKSSKNFTKNSEILTINKKHNSTSITQLTNFNINIMRKNILAQNSEIYKEENFLYSKNKLIKKKEIKFTENILEFFYNIDLKIKGNSERNLILLYSDLNNLDSFTDKILLNNLVEKLINFPEKMKKELIFLNENPNKFLDVIYNSDFYEGIKARFLNDNNNVDKVDNVDNDNLEILDFKAYFYFLKYVKLLFYNFSYLMNDKKFNEIYQVFLNMLNAKDIPKKIAQNDVQILLDIGYEISLILDKLLYHEDNNNNNNNSKENNNIINLDENIPNNNDKNNHLNNTNNFLISLSKKTLKNIFSAENLNQCCNLIEVEENKPKRINYNYQNKNNTNNTNNTKNLLVNNLDEIYFNTKNLLAIKNYTKFIAILNKLENFTKNPENPKNSKMLKNLKFVNLEKIKKFTNETHFSKTNLSTEKLIILYNELNSLNLIPDKFFIRRIKFDGYDFSKFHILYNSFLTKNFWEKEIDLKNLNNILVEKNNLDYFKKFNLEKFFLMRNTFDFIMKNIGFSIKHTNLSSGPYEKEVNLLYFYINFLVKNLDEINNSNTLFEIFYIFANFTSNPKEFFGRIYLKNFDIEEIDEKIFGKFVDSIENRLKNNIQYDHELHILNKLNKNNYNSYDEYMNHIINRICKQFLQKLDKENSQLKESTFINGLKCLKIIFELEINDPDYKIDDYILKNISIIKKKCLLKNSEYLKYIIKENKSTDSELNINNNTKGIYYITKILSFIKYFDNKNLDEVYKKKNDQIYEEFLSLIINNDKNLSIEDMIYIYNNIAEYLLIENSQLSTKEIPKPKKGSSLVTNNNKQFFVFSNTIIRKIAPLLIKKNTINYSNLLNSKIDQNLIPILIINLYNLSIFEKEKNVIIIEILENFMTQITGLRTLKGYEILRLKKEILCENSITQILSILQTIIIINEKKKENLITNIITPDSIRNLVNNIIKKIKSINFSEKINLSPLTQLISTVIDSFDVNEISDILSVLRNLNEENLHPLFMKKLVEKYSNSEILMKILKNKESDFFNFAINWPLFIKSPDLVKLILNCHESKLLQNDRYEIINILSYNNINHIKLLDFFGQSLKIIKRKKKQKDILCEYIFNCNYVNHKISANIFCIILDIYSELTTFTYVEKFEVNELCDIIALMIISKINIEELDEKYKNIFEIIIQKIKENFSTSMTLNIRENVIKYYPSITSEDRNFHKSLLIAKDFDVLNSDYNTEAEKIIDINENDNIEGVIETEKSYLRQSNDSKNSVDKEFEDFFAKKKDIMYGHQTFNIDDMEYRIIIKQWCLAKIMGIDVENESILNKLIFVLIKQQELNKKSDSYERLYLKMITFAFNNNYNLFSGHKNPDSGLVADYYIKNKSNTKEIYLLFIPNNFTCYEFPDNNIFPDGVFQIYIDCLRKFVTKNNSENDNKVEIFLIFESEIQDYSDKEIQVKVLDKISEFMENKN